MKKNRFILLKGRTWPPYNQAQLDTIIICTWPCFYNIFRPQRVRLETSNLFNRDLWCARRERKRGGKNKGGGGGVYTRVYPKVCGLSR
jgi:hypothetical protein